MSDQAELELGEAAKKFLQTDLGKYLDGCSLQDVEAAKDSLLELDPYEFKDLRELQSKITSLQQKANVAVALRSYLADIIERGNQAEHQLNPMSEE